MLYVYTMAREGQRDVAATTTSGGMKGATGRVTVSLVLLYLGGTWVVDGAVSIATQLGVDDALSSLRARS